MFVGCVVDEVLPLISDACTKKRPKALVSQMMGSMAASEDLSNKSPATRSGPCLLREIGHHHLTPLMCETVMSYPSELVLFSFFPSVRRSSNHLLVPVPSGSILICHDLLLTSLLKLVLFSIHILIKAFSYFPPWTNLLFLETFLLSNQLGHREQSPRSIICSGTCQTPTGMSGTDDAGTLERKHFIALPSGQWKESLAF